MGGHFSHDKIYPPYNLNKYTLVLYQFDLITGHNMQQGAKLWPVCHALDNPGLNAKTRSNVYSPFNINEKN